MRGSPTTRMESQEWGELKGRGRREGSGGGDTGGGETTRNGKNREAGRAAGCLPIFVTSLDFSFEDQTNKEQQNICVEA